LLLHSRYLLLLSRSQEKLIVSIVIICPNRDNSDWVAALHSIDSTLNVEVWPEILDPEAVEFVVSWDQPPHVFDQFPNLKCISSIGAGVEHLLNDTTVPAGIPLVRLVDDGLKQSMAEYVMLGVLGHFRRFSDYRRQQAQAKWKPLQIPHISQLGIGIMGFGEIGGYVGRKLSDFGFTVYGWNRSRKRTGDMQLYSEQDELGEFLKNSNVLVCLLPLTEETQNILNAQNFSQLPSGAYLINAGRGGHLVDDDLLAALDSGQLSGALLDVFNGEPLPQQHPFWSHEKITVTPHTASVTNPESASAEIVENYRRVLNNEPLLNLVEVDRGY
jgi:glyoxylate/hydroxypyruvate reductase A